MTQNNQNSGVQRRFYYRDSSNIVRGPYILPELGRFYIFNNIGKYDIKPIKELYETRQLRSSYSIAINDSHFYSIKSVTWHNHDEIFYNLFATYTFDIDYIWKFKGGQSI